LQEVGIDFRDDAEALQMWKDAGADVKGERVRFPKGLVRGLIKTAPSQFTQYARNADRSVVIGGDHTVFAPVYGPRHSCVISMAAAVMRPSRISAIS
jgi:trimethylamine--corrinoid protein Co-methyltransferase